MDDLDLNKILSDSPGYLLGTASRLLRERQVEALKPLKLTHNQYVVLRLVKTDISLTQASIGSKYGIDPASMVSVLDSLERRNLLQRVRNIQDRRKYLISLTPKGSNLVAYAIRVVRKEQKDFLGVLNSTEWEILRAILCKLIGIPIEKVTVLARVSDSVEKDAETDSVAKVAETDLPTKELTSD